MDRIIFRENSEISIAHTISKNHFPKKVEMVSEVSPVREDQIIFSYPFYRLVFCTSGSAEFIIIKEKKPFTLEVSEGNAMIIKPEAFIKSINHKPYETCGILLRPQSMDYFTNDHLCRHRHRFMLPIRYVRKELYLLFEQCVEFSNIDRLRQQYAMLIWAHFDEIIKKQTQSKGAHITFIKVKYYVIKHFQHGINRKIVAAELGLNQDYLNALFQQFSGLSFTQYLLKIKLEKANELLHDKNLSISQIAKLAGFGSNTYFGRQFKRYYNMTPLHYRKSLD
ncbi:helix-turn-helix domain-containing protein [Desulforhopalus sp. IMCC35007]|uniref:helix-turn-helix domain-containing protein n=1 Tax=Desulforhopalus sp. IMCC35007 TaxID=2569543 RepID=UPI0010AE931B|nr:AraC family transcriptional regulator [Desulforhopalus sp. IMCC35007]TKB06594.1 helix-turn-helix transcriptional regulator [Desulforhopalus sp. IMCC35007]